MCIRDRTNGLSRGVWITRSTLSVDRTIPVSYTHLDVYKRQLLDGLDVVAPRMTETTARLRRALDDVDQVIAQQRVTRSQRRVKTVL